MTAGLVSTSLLYVDPCPVCDVRAMVSDDGLLVTCQNCGVGGTTDGLTIHRGLLPFSRPSAAVVYYVRFGDRVKIGTSANLTQRLASLPCDEVLATEPGSYDLEKQRHRELAASRIYANREWFHYTGQVRAHIAGLRHG